ncbi:MAG: hypothetical protein MZV49_13490 [Rhodopseudomonas palustris]|nr:hypothetical protein [Rhodopseudomonas palustris]
MFSQGDHLKSASDVNLPLIAVGLMYQQGYFPAVPDPDGWQQKPIRRTTSTICRCTSSG